MRVKCNFCKKYYKLDCDKTGTKETEYVRCENCGRAITVKFKGKIFYEEEDWVDEIKKFIKSLWK